VDNKKKGIGQGIGVEERVIKGSQKRNINGRNRSKTMRISVVRIKS
jgi:hypothetical protein